MTVLKQQSNSQALQGFYVNVRAQLRSKETLKLEIGKSGKIHMRLKNLKLPILSTLDGGSRA